MKEIIKNSLILCIITLVSGVLLGAVYEGTKKPRAEQEEKTKQEAYKKVFEEADRFEELEYDETALKTYLKITDIRNIWFIYRKPFRHWILPERISGM